MAGLRRMVASYRTLSAERARANVRWGAGAVGGRWAIEATRAIAPGEELFLSYGPAYWLSLLSNHHPDPLVRLLAYCYLGEEHRDSFPDRSIYSGPGHRPLLSDTGEEADESWCRLLINEVTRPPAGLSPFVDGSTFSWSMNIRTIT
jgi:hypothetical protein